MNYVDQLHFKQKRLEELTIELEEILTEIPKLQAVVDALNALGVEPTPEPTPEPEPVAAPAVDEQVRPVDPDVLKAQELLAKARGLRVRVSEMKAEAEELGRS